MINPEYSEVWKHFNASNTKALKEVAKFMDSQNAINQLTKQGIEDAIMQIEKIHKEIRVIKIALVATLVGMIFITLGNM